MLLRGADWLVPCSEELADMLRAFVPECASRIARVPNGIDCDRFLQSADTSFELPAHFAGRTRIVSVGAFRSIKGHDLLLRAFAQLKRTQRNICLVLEGGEGSELEKTKQLAGELDLLDDVLFLRNLPNSRVAARLGKADLFVFSSRREAFGLVLLEAAVMETPIVAATTGAVRELITDGVSGWTVPVEDFESLAHAMANALKDPGERARRAKRLRTRVVEEFTWSKVRRQYEALVSKST